MCVVCQSVQRERERESDRAIERERNRERERRGRKMTSDDIDGVGNAVAFQFSIRNSPHSGLPSFTEFRRFRPSVTGFLVFDSITSGFKGNPIVPSLPSFDRAFTWFQLFIQFH